MEHAKKLFPNGLPTLEELKAFNAGKDVPPETAWIWGENDELGRINLLTPEVTQAAKESELKDGTVVSLNWTVKYPEKPSFHRPAFQHKIAQHPLSPCIFDDYYDMNTQSGSQWDGFRHFGHLGLNRLYNNLKPEEVLSSTRCGIQAISQHGIAGRGVLLDHYSWAKKQGRPYDPVSGHAIPVSELLEVAKAQNVEFRPGDILLIRSGYVSRYYELQKENPAKLEELSHNECFAGVEQSEEMKKFLHDKLTGITQKLSEECEKRQRWTFFFTSAPFNTPGGIASLANALAIF
ncbi:hypothetical protein T310_1348 [Rasamsonia emersonii CBS 393.64]|uniref:Cyclase n=1 Tax=Rasamsonia emersonii (strain ATCC 16479 / CBS 393.64 / IMI 116815) TaxID=1408163 RepID=A0A0F4Z3C8_RASE3|nr:hypothetical protein T310_1348 [Rasamsonia emersonii CBS 393.64]KKA24601.1 hypothetical protein T310_1348 [Rasamsonia emersonii CBS 393.64]